MIVLQHLGGNWKGEEREAVQKQPGGKWWMQKGTQLAEAHGAWHDLQLQTGNSGRVMFEPYVSPCTERIKVVVQVRHIDIYRQYTILLTFARITA